MVTHTCRFGCRGLSWQRYTSPPPHPTPTPPHLPCFSTDALVCSLTPKTCASRRRSRPTATGCVSLSDREMNWRGVRLRLHKGAGTGFPQHTHYPPSRDLQCRRCTFTFTNMGYCDYARGLKWSRSNVKIVFVFFLFPFYENSFCLCVDARCLPNSQSAADCVREGHSARIVLVLMMDSL